MFLRTQNLPGLSCNSFHMLLVSDPPSSVCAGPLARVSDSLGQGRFLWGADIQVGTQHGKDSNFMGAERRAQVLEQIFRAKGRAAVFDYQRRGWIG